MLIYTMTTEGSIIIIDDKTDMLALLKRLLTRELSCTIDTLTDPRGVDSILASKDVDLVISDVKMPGKDGITLLKEIKAKDRDIPVIILTGFGTIEMAVEALKYGAYDFITKPINNERLVHTVRQAIQYRRIIKEKKLLEEKFRLTTLQRELIGESEAMQALMETIKTVAATDETVLITGETGTGKELVARTIHRLSNRNKGPFITVNCPAIPETILESELFGYRKGAFTSASTDKKGLFEAANEGTIFLDEIGDIPHSVQTKLLRVLQEKEVKPLGDTENIMVDVRVIASTNQNLEERIANGQFREDLYYRLNVIHIHMPNLEERREDIPLLARYFLKEFSLQYDREIKGFTEKALEYLKNRHWKGNVRELQNVIKRAVIFSKSSQIDVEELEKPGSLTPCPETIMDELLKLDYRTAREKLLREFTESYISHIMKKTKGNISQAAALAGVERQSLQHLLKKYNIDISKFR